MGDIGEEGRGTEEKEPEQGRGTQARREAGYERGRHSAGRIGGRE